MNCKKVIDRLSLFLGNELSEKENQEITLHLEQCQLCQKELSELKATYGLLNQVEPVIKFPHPTDDFLPQVRRKIKSLYAPVPRRRLLPRLMPIFAPTLMVLVIVITGYVNHIQQIRRETDERVFSGLTEEKTSAAFLYDILDTETQNAINEQAITDIPATDLQGIESELYSGTDVDDILSSLTDDEKESIANELLNKYVKVQENNDNRANTSPGG